MISTAEEHPNILLHVAPFDHDKSYNPLQSFPTYAHPHQTSLCSVVAKKNIKQLVNIW